MEKIRQYRFLKKVEKMLNAPVRPAENYDTGMDAMYVGASAPRTAGHFADGSVSTRQNQVKTVAELLLEVIEVIILEKKEKGDGGDADDGKENVLPKLVELEVLFQELDMGLLFTEKEKTERAEQAMLARSTIPTERVSLPARRRMGISTKDLEEMKAEILQWRKELLERKKKLYKIETTVRDLGVNINDVRCRNLERDRRDALALLKTCTDLGIGLLKGIMARLNGEMRGD